MCDLTATVTALLQGPSYNQIKRELYVSAFILYICILFILDYGCVWWLSVLLFDWTKQTQNVTDIMGLINCSNMNLDRSATRTIQYMQNLVSINAMTLQIRKDDWQLFDIELEIYIAVTLCLCEWPESREDMFMSEWMRWTFISIYELDY